MVLASDAVVMDGELIGDPTEGALVALAAKGGVDAVSTRHAYPRVAELPFDAAYKLMATFHRMTDESGDEVVRCFVKGAPDQLLGPRVERARRRRGPGPGRRVGPRAVPRGEQAARARGPPGAGHRAQGLRRRRPSTPAPTCCRWWDGLELLSLVGIVDPPRPTAKASIATAKAAGIRVRMITGDHAVTAGAIARELGIEGTVITGAEFAAMDDERSWPRSTTSASSPG